MQPSRRIHHSVHPEARVIRSSEFTWVPATNGVGTLVAEASDLGLFHRLFAPLYSDAADQGFWILSERTNAAVAFVFVGEDVDREGETQGWRFEGWRGGKLVCKALVIND